MSWKKYPYSALLLQLRNERGKYARNFHPHPISLCTCRLFCVFCSSFEFSLLPLPSFLFSDTVICMCAARPPGPAAVPCENFNGWPVSPSFIIFERNCAQKRWNFVNKIDKEQQQLTIKLRLSPYLLKIRRVALKNWVEWHVLSSFNPMLVHCKWQELLP